MLDGLLTRLKGGRRLRHEWRQFREHRVHPHLIRGRIRHVFGPERVNYGPDEVLVCCIVRNGEPHIQTYLEHHLGLGVRHIVFLDNGSTDRTREIIRESDRVSLLETDCRYHVYENTLKRYLAGRFSRGRWNLFVDVDELFDYPYSDVVPLSSLLGYLNQRQYTAVITQMLDMFSDLPLKEVREIGDFRESQPFYDVTSVTKIDYRFGTPANPDIKEHRGGIRDAIFGTGNGLTKASLALVEDPARLFYGWHHVRGARLADISCVLLHYPFVGSFREKVLEAVETRRYGKVFTQQYDRYHATMAAQPKLSLKLPSANRLERVEQLVDQGFLAVSPSYIQWVAAHVGSDRTTVRPCGSTPVTS